MTKSEYMKELQEGLRRYNVSVEREILEDYEQHFAEGLAHGRTEEEIIDELGSIEDMLQEFSEDDLKQEIEKVEMQASQSNSYQHCYREVVIDALLADVVICDAKDDQIRVDYENRGSKAQKLKYYFYQYDKDGVFYAGVKEKKGVDLGTGALRGLFSQMNWSGGDIDLRIEIPAGIPVLRVHTTSGDQEIQDIRIGELEAQCSSGDLEIKGAACDKLCARTSSGDMEVSRVHMDAQKDTSIELYTTSGNMEIGELVTSHMCVQTGSGDVEARELQIGNLKMQADSGEIGLEHVQGSLIRLQTGSGEIRGRDIQGEELAAGAGSGDVSIQANVKTYDLKTGSGDIELRVGADARQIRLIAGSGDICADLGMVEGATIETRTASGDVSLRGDEISGFRDRYTYGSGACQVKITTGSGDIRVS
ncbi:MAG: DUF4097 family beta strand repeat-containing protein [Muribaculum sp.]|nr:DUF4097 family beta strand repeat-containing protein [Muribaculum sp.]